MWCCTCTTYNLAKGCLYSKDLGRALSVVNLSLYSCMYSFPLTYSYFLVPSPSHSLGIAYPYFHVFLAACSMHVTWCDVHVLGV